MNRLTAGRRTAVIKALVEGSSVRSTCRMTGTAKGTVLKLLAEIGEACKAFHDRTVRNVTAKRVQCDELWSFCYAKERNVPEQLEGQGFGDVWTWVGIDADSKLAIGWLVGDRDAKAAQTFMRDIASRLANRVQLTTDGHHHYLTAVERAFGWAGIDYAQLVKFYTSHSHAAGGRYSPGTFKSAKPTWIMGQPVREHVSTSFVERQNFSMRMEMRRFTRLTNAFSKKVANHAHAVALHFVHYNFCRIHTTLTERNEGIHQTPAMAAGLTNRVWGVPEIVALLEASEQKAAS